MPPRNRPDGPLGPEPVKTTERSDEEVFLDRFVDTPFGGTKLYNFFRSYPANNYFPSRREVERLAQHKVKEIFGAFENVRYILERHEARIRKRWVKKSTAKRSQLLLTAHPGMASDHRPDLAADLAARSVTIHGNQFVTSPIATARNSEACMVPFLNLEDPLQPGTFLTFLNSRGRAPVESFIQTQLLNCPIARCPISFILSRLQEYTMVLVGQDTRDTYGQMRQWTDMQDAWQSIYRGQGVHPGHGIQILCIQEIIYRFLERCCHLLVSDLLTDEKGGSDNYPILPLPGRVVNHSVNYTNRAEVSLMTPYITPGQLDFDCLRGLVSSKVDELEDHIWALREDPGYFSEVCDNYKTHRCEYITSTDGNVNAIIKEPPHAMTGAILRNLITDPYLALFYWQDCLRLVKSLQTTALENDFNSLHHPDLPPDYHNDFLRLWKMFHALHTDIHECFRQRLPAAPGMKKYFIKTYANPNSGKCHFRINTAPANGDPAVVRFLTVLSRIWCPHEPPEAGFVAELDDLERMVVNEPALKNLLSSYVWSDFSQISIASECIQQIRSYQPWAARIHHDAHRLELLMACWFQDFGIKWAPVTGMNRFKTIALARLADPLDGKFRYPATENKSRETTEAMRLAEFNLDTFWTAADNFCKKLTGASFPDLLQDNAAAGRTIRRTAPWIEPVPERLDPTPSEHISKLPIYPCSRGLDTTEDDYIKASGSLKDKVKSRGIVNPAKTAGNDLPIDVRQLQAHEVSLGSPGPHVKVDKRSYLVFKTLFFSRTSRDVPGEIPWKEFVHAMVQRGFEAEKLHGSSWRFTPTTLGAGRSIQFHAPHGALSKLSLTWARRYGRRLEWHYGWKGEIFTLA